MPYRDDKILQPAHLRFRGWIGALIGLWTLAVAIVLTCEVLDEFIHAQDLLLEINKDVKRDKQAVQAMQRINIRDRLLGYGGMWLLGLAGISLFSRHLRQQMDRRSEAERKLQEAHDRLEQRVVERTAELADANRRLEGEVVERRKAEQWLLESEERFRGYFEQGLVGMAILSPEIEWIEVNGRLCRMLGYTEDELAMVRWDALTHPEDLPPEKSHFQTLLDGTASGFIFDKRFIRKDKAVFPVSLYVQCMRKPDGRIDCLLALVQENPHRGRS
jgi:PAS domain S-box-containing protein